MAVTKIPKIKKGDVFANGNIEAAMNYDYHSKRINPNKQLNFPDFEYDNFIPKKKFLTKRNKCVF